MNKTLAFNILYGVYFVSTLLCAFTVFSKKRGLRNIGRYALGAAFLWHTMVIAQRWWLAGRPPMSNMFETLVFFGWCVVLVYLIFDLRYGLRALAAPTGLADQRPADRLVRRLRLLGRQLPACRSS